MFRMGRIPARGEETELEAHAWTRRGFFGAYATIYKTHNPGHARWEVGLGPAQVDVNQVRTPDGERADGLPLPLMTSGEATVSVSKRTQPMPCCWRNADADELYFIDKGRCRFETELGRLEAQPGDMVYLPRNIIYRTIPLSDDTQQLILETVPLLESAEAYHRAHGEVNFGLDMSLIQVPEPWENTNPAQAEFEVRTKVDGQLLSAFYDFDPVGVTVGWSGDPLVYKLSGWDVPSASLPSTPPTAAVFVTDASEVMVSLHTPRQGPGGTAGPPSHTNDYDELWFQHSPTGETGGRFSLLRWEPQGATQPGFRRPPAAGGAVQPHYLMFNIDVRKRLHYTPEAREYVVHPQAQAAVAG